MGRNSNPRYANVCITSFSKKGHGIGTSTDEFQRQVEVPFLIPGDQARVMLTRKRSGVFGSQLEEITAPSPMRIPAKCVHFGVCGGCRWQQMPYEEQLRIKQEKVAKLFNPILDTQARVYPILACDPPWNYRNKMEFTFSEDATGRHFVGLIINDSRGKVLNLTECHLVNPWFETALAAARAWWHESGLAAYHPHKDSGSLRTLTVREGMSSGDRLIMLTVSGNPDFALNKQHLESFVAFMRDAIDPPNQNANLSIFLRIHQAVKGMETNFYEMLLHGPDHIRETLHISTHVGEASASLNFAVSPSAFFQPNTKQAEKLYSHALQALEIPDNSVVYDLYCGTGTLGICAAKKAKQVIGIELSPEAALDARTNATLNGLKNIQIFTGAAREVMNIWRTSPEYLPPDVVMVDPPRVGLDEGTLKHLIEMRPPKLLYISCNPETQVENIKVLLGAGYKLQTIQPVDQFPHTVHIENIAVLTL